MSEGVQIRAPMPHTPPLDGIRAIAIALVFAAHAGLSWVVPGGFGVTIFFFLSGYLITTLMRVETARTGRIGLGAFYLRRILRIFPPLYITLALALLLSAAGLLADKVSFVGVAGQFAFLTNYADLLGPNDGLPLPLWSLAVEEHFYLLFPVCYLLWLGRMDGRRAAAWCFAVCVAVLCVRVAIVLGAADYSTNYVRTHTRIDSILFGCCLALWNNPVLDRDPYRPTPLHVAAALGVLLACFAIRSDAFRESARYSLQGGALFVLFSYALQARGIVARVLASRILARIALYSYSLYLIHTVAFSVLERTCPQMPLVGSAAIALLASLLYADAMYRFVEQPAARLRRRWHGAEGSSDQVRAAKASAGAALTRGASRATAP